MCFQAMSKCFSFPVESAIVGVNDKILEESTDSAQFLEVLQNENLSLRAVSPDNIEYYRKGLAERLKRKREEVCTL